MQLKKKISNLKIKSNLIKIIKKKSKPIYVILIIGRKKLRTKLKNYIHTNRKKMKIEKSVSTVKKGKTIYRFGKAIKFLKHRFSLSL